MFYAVLALLVLEKKETSKHSGAIALFDRDFVKKDARKKNLCRWLHDAVDLRQRPDNGAEFHVSGEEAKALLKNAEEFVKEVKKVLHKEM